MSPLITDTYSIKIHIATKTRVTDACERSIQLPSIANTNRNGNCFKASQKYQVQRVKIKEISLNIVTIH